MSNFISKKSRNFVRAAVASLTMVCVGLTAAVVTTPAHAQSLSTSVARELTKAVNIIQASAEPGDAEYRAALVILDNLIANRSGSMKAYDKATVYEIIGAYRAQLDPPDYAGSLRAFELALAQDALPQERERQVRFFIAQLYFQEEDYAKAIRFLREYIDFQEASGAPVGANTYYLLAAAYTAQDNFRSALPPMETALRLHEAAVAAPVPEGGNPIRRNKSYYDLLNSIYSQNDQTSQRITLLEKMLRYWPDDASYWEQLFALYSGEDRESDAAAVLELAYNNGLVTDPDRIINLVEYYSLVENPHRGALLLERELAAGNIERTQKHLELLAQLWNLSREQKKAAAALEEAAQMAPTGELYYRLGQIYFADEQFRKSEQTLTSALDRGGLKAADRGNIWLLIGNARYNIDTNSPTQRSRAKQAWRNAINTTGARDADRKAAQGWLDYVNAVERTECNQDRVERLVIVDNYKKEKASCEANLNIVDRSGSTFSVGLSETRIAQCRRIVASSINDTSAIITYDDGTTEGTEVPGFCRN